MQTNPMDNNLHRNENELQVKLVFWLGKEEEEIRQKRREYWLKHGDRNTKFFHNACKVRHHTNQLNHLILSDKGESYAKEEPLRSPRILQQTVQ